MHKLFAAALVAAIPGFASAHEFQVHQKGNQFDTSMVKVKVGDTVTFMNEDPHHHNIFSLSDTQPFDLGSFRGGESRKVTFAKDGRIDVECAIHPGMKMTVEVVK